MPQAKNQAKKRQLKHSLFVSCLLTLFLSQYFLRAAKAVTPPVAAAAPPPPANSTAANPCPQSKPCCEDKPVPLVSAVDPCTKAGYFPSRTGTLCTTCQSSDCQEVFCDIGIPSSSIPSPTPSSVPSATAIANVQSPVQKTAAAAGILQAAQQRASEAEAAATKAENDAILAKSTADNEQLRLTAAKQAALQPNAPADASKAVADAQTAANTAQAQAESARTQADKLNSASTEAKNAVNAYQKAVTDAQSAQGDPTNVAKQQAADESLNAANTQQAVAQKAADEAKAAATLPAAPPGPAGETTKPAEESTKQNALERVKGSLSAGAGESDNSMGMMMAMSSGDPAMAMMGMGSDCTDSEKVNSKYNCTAARHMTTAAAIANQAGQSAGSMVVQGEGQINTMNAQAASMNLNGTGSGQAAIMDAAANTQQITGETELSTGGLNAVLGAIQLMQAAKLGQNAKELTAAGAVEVIKPPGNPATPELPNTNALKASDGNDITQSMLTEFAKNTDTAEEGQQIVRHIASVTSSEQKQAQANSLMGGMMSLTTGLSQLASGAFALEAAKTMREEASAMKGASPVPKISGSTGTPLAAPGLPAAPQLGSLSGGGANSATGAAVTPIDGGSSAASAASPNPSLSGLPSLGAGIGTGVIPAATPSGPAPGTFNPSDPGSGQGGGGQGGGGGGDGLGPSDVNAGSGDQGKPADPSGGVSYATGGGGAAYSGGAGGGKGGGSDGGSDLSGLLSKLLPKKDDEKAANKGVVDYGGEAASPYSYLDRDANIFERIHEYYQSKNKAGAI